MRTFQDIAIKYRTRLAGKYNAAVYSCPECGYKNVSHFGDVIGFAESAHGVMQICECPDCFTKWHCHARLKRNDSDRDTYDYFLISIAGGWNLHHKAEE